MAVLMFALGFWKDSPVLQSIYQRLRITKLLKLRSDPSNEEIGVDSKVATLEKNSDALLHLVRIQENQRLIHKVIHYWFGQYSPDESQKHLWMIAHSSLILREKVDQEIAIEFQDLLLELSGVSLSKPSSRWNEWCGSSDNEISYGFQGKIAAIIVLDQFSRHILRHRENGGESSSPALPSKEHLDTWALQTAEVFVERHAQEIKCGMVPLPMYIFSLMPFRHASTIETVKLVQQRIEELASLDKQMESMLGRFRKASNRRMAVLQDEARRSGKLCKTSDNIDRQPSIYSDEDILETFAFDADMGPACNHPCVRTIQTFLADRGIRPNKKSSNDLSVPIVVSLSGGVDSMVIASILGYLNSSCEYRLDIWAVHIDYANRPESGAEADFVRRFCERLGFTFQLRRIAEVTRGVTARDQYERIARDLRFTSYRETIAKARKGGETIGVMLGHHRGDLRENVLSNAHKGCGPLDLSGMTDVSRNEGVIIYRPLLPLEKSYVLDYAHKFGVPYFKGKPCTVCLLNAGLIQELNISICEDTTPHWSTRGKLRNLLIPLLEDIYGEGSLKNLSNLAVDSDECRALFQKSMIGPFLDGVQRYPMGISFDTRSWKEQAVFFWKIALREALHSASLGMFSDKSVLAFLERVQAKEIREGWLQCRRDYAVYLQGDGRVFVLYPSSFPFNKNEMYDVEGQVVEYNDERRVGPWIVKAEIVGETKEDRESCILAERALPSMNHFMNGVVEYIVEVPTWDVNGTDVPRPLVFCRFSKASRPAAWKNEGRDENLYRKVQETLPLLGNDKIALAAMTSPRVNFLVEEGNGEQQPVLKRLVRVTLKVTDPKTSPWM